MDELRLAELAARGLSQRAIAKELDSSQTNVRYWLIKYGLDTQRERPPRVSRTPASAQFTPPGPLKTDEPLRDTNRISACTESRVLAALTAAGYSCYVPFGVARADLAIETEEGVKSVQVKTGAVRENGSVLIFQTSSTDRKGRRQHYRGAVDFFATAAPGLPGVFLVPVAEAPRATMHLRLSPPRNNQVGRIWLAEHYLLPGSGERF